MPERLYSAAPSRLTTYLDCPRRYRMAYLDRPHAAEGPAVGAQLGRRGGAHRAGQLVGPAARAAAPPRPAARCWSAAGSPTASATTSSRARRGSGPGSRSSATSPTSTPTTSRSASSAPSRSRPPRASLWGRVDRIDDRAGEGVVVVDYKTGRSVLTVDDARTSLALAVYAAAAARTLRRPCTRVELHHLPTGEVRGLGPHRRVAATGTCAGPTRWPPSSAASTSGSRPGMSAGGGRRGVPGAGRARGAAGATSGPAAAPGGRCRARSRGPASSTPTDGELRYAVDPQERRPGTSLRPRPWKRACTADGVYRATALIAL